MSEQWKDDEWAVVQICGRKERLSVEQVRAIRTLSTRYSADEIADQIGALNAGQVERVIRGQTYAGFSSWIPVMTDGSGLYYESRSGGANG